MFISLLLLPAFRERSYFLSPQWEEVLLCVLCRHISAPMYMYMKIWNCMNMKKLDKWFLPWADKHYKWAKVLHRCSYSIWVLAHLINIFFLQSQMKTQWRDTTPSLRRGFSRPVRRSSWKSTHSIQVFHHFSYTWCDYCTDTQRNCCIDCVNQWSGQHQHNSKDLNSNELNFLLPYNNFAWGIVYKPLM